MEPKMGSPFQLVFYAPDSVTAAALARQSFALVDSLNAVFSDYAPDSELNRLCATAGKDSFVAVSPALYQMIVTSQKAWKQSWYTFDITIGPLSRLWRTARREKRFPSPAEIKAARQPMGFQNILIDTVARRIQLIKPGMQLDLGGIAKGHIAQQVVNFLRSKGITAVMADAGGDIVCGAAPPGKKGWTLGINIPEQSDQLLDRTISLQHQAVATSGDVYQYTVHNGKKYSHIINPLTGYGVTFQRNVTVIAPDGATADWLATACSILPLRKAKKLARKMDAALLVTQIKNDKIQFYWSPVMEKYWNNR